MKQELHKDKHGVCGCAPRAMTEAESAPAGAGAIPPVSDTTAVYFIENMDCPMEEALIRKKIKGMPGIRKLEFRLMERMLIIHHQLASLQGVEKALREIDMTAVPYVYSDVAPVRKEGIFKSRKGVLLGIALVCAVVAEGLELAYGDVWAVFAVSLVAIFLSGISTYKKGLIALRHLNLNMNALMSVAVTGAVLIGKWPEAAMVMVLFTLSEMIEAFSLYNARNAIHKLLTLAPAWATVQQADGSWREEEVKHVTIGMRVKVRPGERFALDGTVVAGISTVNQAPITGESLPVEKGIGDRVFAGSINEAGVLEYITSSSAETSTLAHIIQAVESAQTSKAPIQRFVDRFAQVYTPVVFLAAVGMAVIPPLCLGAEWMTWIYRALVALVIACPCALVISTPVSIVSALTAASRHGILVKGGMYLEIGHQLRCMAFDKTGTITHGRPQQTDMVVWGDADRAVCLSIAVSLASQSDHPVSKAIVEGSGDGVAIRAVSDFEAVAGMGVQGRINKEVWFLGSHRMLHERGLCTGACEGCLDALEAKGNSVVVLFNGAGVQAIFAVADAIKESSVQAIATLKKLGIQTLMLTGDNEHTARIIAGQAGVDAYQAALLPTDKLKVVQALAKEGRVGMVGDGINDAPALAAADIGFAMGVVGSDTAIETANVALMDDDLRKVPVFIRLSKVTRRIILQNISFALGVKAAFLLLAFAGISTMWMAVFADMGTSLLVIGNGLRLLRK